MGLKRPFGDELSELSFKHPRQGENGYRLSAYAENLGPEDSMQKPDISGTGEFQNGFHKLQWSDIHADELGNDFETNAPLSWITSSSSEEDDTGFDPIADSSLSPEYFGFNFPHKAVVSFEDIYSSSPQSPRKRVPIGPNHQAIIPSCVRRINRENSLETDSTFNGGNEERLMGTCIIPMPESNPTSHSAIDGRRNCSCLNLGSVCCVRQHVKEAREKLMDTLGRELFINLGFGDMGEEVASKWSADEERIFHEVVYSNPHRNFWMNISSVFPSRTKAEIVSYYFNVFMLRRRAAQNRSKLLDIDSDDDEWHDCNHQGSYQVRITADEDFSTELPASDDEAELAAGSPDEDDDDEDSDNDDDGGDSGNSTGATCDGWADSTEDGDINYDSLVPYMDNFDVQDNSCTSFECQGNTASTCPVDDAGNAKCLLSKVDGSGDGWV